MILQMYVRASSWCDRELMCFAAAAVACAGGLRPSELLGGTAAHLRERALRVNQLVFYADRDGTVVLPTATCVGATFASIMPDHCVVTLHVSKTNQMHHRQPIEIAAPTVVRALWWWRHARGAADDACCLFQLTGFAPLRTASLISHVQSELRSLGHTGLTLTGKCFRIGLASTLGAVGASPADISVAGHWSTRGNTWAQYADPASHRRRARELNRQMEVRMTESGIDTYGASSLDRPPPSASASVVQRTRRL